MARNPKDKASWEEKLINLYYAALETYIEELSLSPKLREELKEDIEEDDILLLAELLVSLTKMFLHQEGWLRLDEGEEWDFPFPPSPYVH